MGAFDFFFLLYNTIKSRITIRSNNPAPTAIPIMVVMLNWLPLSPLGDVDASESLERDDDSGGGGANRGRGGGDGGENSWPDGDVGVCGGEGGGGGDLLYDPSEGGGGDGKE